MIKRKKYIQIIDKKNYKKAYTQNFSKYYEYMTLTSSSIRNSSIFQNIYNAQNGTRRNRKPKHINNYYKM